MGFNYFSTAFPSQKGQSLVEAVIAVAVSAMTILVAISVITLSLRISQQDESYQAAVFLEQKIANSLTSMAEKNWAQIAALTSGNKYHIAPDANNNGFVISAGEATTTINSIIYTHYFTVEPIDERLKKAVIVIAWPFRGSTAEINLTQYLARTDNRVLRQTDWSGGPTDPSDPVISGAPRQFLKADSAVDFATSPGIIRITK